MRDLERAQHAKERAERDLVVLDVASKRIEPLHDVLQNLKESATAWVNDLAGKAALEQSNSASLNASINEARAASRAAHDELEATQAKLNEIRIENAARRLKLRSRFPRRKIVPRPRVRRSKCAAA